MNLTGLFQYGNKNTRNTGSESIKTQGSGSASSSHSQQAIKGLRPGQTIQGEIVGKNGNEVQIRTDSDTVITARLYKDMNVSVGQSMIFEVKNNSGTQIALRPLYENLAQDANVLRALEAARLPATNELMRMVSTMMEQGMSIDRNSLLDMSKLIAANPGSNPETIVLMKNMQLPITPENIQQFENYQRYEHQIINGAKDIIAELPQFFQAMTGAGQGAAALDLYAQILQLFSGEKSGEAQVNPRVFTDIAGEAGYEAGSGEPAGETIAGKESNPETIQAQTQNRMAQEALDMIAGHKQTPDKNMVSNNEGQNLAQNIVPGENAQSYKEGSLGAVLDAGARNQLAGMLEGMGFSEEQLRQIQTGNISVRELLGDIGRLIDKGGVGERTDILQLLGSREFSQILNKEIMAQWLIKPEQVAKKEDVEAFYGRLREQTARLTEALSQTAKDTPLSKSLTAMQNNIDFMNQVNQMYNYIQLPLKMSGGDAHGDLYVYTNRKSAAREDGSVSALLHLDMEHLGTMDIYVLMKDKNVSTKFYLANETVIDFIAEHIHTLNERLEKRGYSVQAEMLKLDKTEDGSTNVMKTLEAKEGDGSSLLAQYSFDVRA